MGVVPVWFTQRERQALMDAAELAGINVLSLMNDHTACTSWAPAGWLTGDGGALIVVDARWCL